MIKKSVLLVDDEQAILMSLGNYLGKNNFTVTPVLNGEDALSEIHTSPGFDIVITDLEMPGISGIELLKEIRKDNVDIGVFILTGHENMASKREALRFGANDFLQKPCDADELVFKMNKFLKDQRGGRRLLNLKNLCQSG
ncbi:MAG: DNA-binding NtrC family response regulator [Desulforhopalus sp.]|jgi:DNA-binding NtrC family response regulator